MGPFLDNDTPDFFNGNFWTDSDSNTRNDWLQSCDETQMSLCVELFMKIAWNRPFRGLVRAGSHGHKQPRQVAIWDRSFVRLFVLFVSSDGANKK